jgi:archaeal flagellar protein FlaJ
MEIKIRHFLGLFVGLVIGGTSFYYLYYTSRNLFYFLAVLSYVIAVLPFMIAFLVDRGLQHQKEEKFLEFTRDLVEGVKSGTPINKSIINLQKRDYGSLSPHIQKLANQIHFGINLNKAFDTFAKETKSRVITRAMLLISEAQRAGGQIETIISSVAHSVNQIEDLKKERLSSVYNLVVQGYIIFFVFIIIMLVLEYAILPLAIEFSQSQVEGLTSTKSAILTKEQFSTPLFVMLIVQSLFAGLVIGKVSEGTILGGIKHSFFLVTITLLVVTGTRALLG